MDTLTDNQRKGALIMRALVAASHAPSNVSWTLTAVMPRVDRVHGQHCICHRCKRPT